jgi:hypothetical protein
LPVAGEMIFSWLTSLSIRLWFGWLLEGPGDGSVPSNWIGYGLYEKTPDTHMGM